MISQVQCLCPHKGCSGDKRADYFNELGTWLYVFVLVIWPKRGRGEVRRISTNHSEFYCTPAGTDGL